MRRIFYIFEVSQNSNISVRWYNISKTNLVTLLFECKKLLNSRSEMFMWNCERIAEWNSSNFETSIFLNLIKIYFTIHRMQIWRTTRSSPGTSHESESSEASEASVFFFDINASPEKSYFVDGVVCFISLCLRVFEFLNATRREWNLPQERKSFSQFSRSPLRGRQTK